MAEKARQKGYEVAEDIKKLLEADKKRRELLQQVEDIRRQKNELAKQGRAEDREKYIQKGKELREKEGNLVSQIPAVELYLKRIPNIPAEDVPVGSSEKENVVAKESGKKPKFDFEPKTHWQLGEDKGLIDKERATKVAGARFTYLLGNLVKLQFALIQFALDILSSEESLKKIIDQFDLRVPAVAFTPVLPPAMAKTEVYEATGRLNKQEQTYKLEDEDLWLNASAEHTLAPMFMGEVLEVNKLPLRFVGYTTAFRREAGTYGKDTEGIIRLHQFDKLEMESFTLPLEGLNEHLFMVAIQEYLMLQLELPYRVINKCTADIGFPNARGVDIEAWMPGQDRYVETHTADFISDFQAEGTKTRVKTEQGNIYVHNNDATVFAAGRMMAAIMENYQCADGSIGIPKVLQSYMGGQTEL